MPNITVNGVSFAYEVFGKGRPIVWNTHGWFPRDTLAYFVAGRLSAHYQVLIWDRRNSGGSDLSLADASYEHDLWVEDLHCLMAALKMTPAYLAGACNGAALSLLLARRYPGDVKGLILVAPPCLYTAATPHVGFILEGHFESLAEVATQRGMEAVLAESGEAWLRIVTGRAEPRDWLMDWVAQTTATNPENRERLLSVSPKDFAATMRRWARWYGKGPGYLHGVSYDEIRPIALPTLVAHGFDPVHPKDTAEELCRIIPRAEWVEYSDRYTAEEMDQAGRSWGLALPFMKEFVDRVEAHTGAT